jgi:hypothetical protein
MTTFKKFSFGLLCLFCLFEIPVCFGDSKIRVSTLPEIKLDEIELDYSLNSSIERNRKAEKNNLAKDAVLLLKGKFKIINGDIKMGEFYLNQIDDSTTQLLQIKRRYLAIIEFLRGNFKNSLLYLNGQNQSTSKGYAHICLLRLLNFMSLNQTKNLMFEANSCMSETGKYSKNDQFWLDVMINLQTKNLSAVNVSLMQDVDRTLTDDEMSRIWLKTGLYINKESELLKLLSLLPDSSYSSKKIREIISLLYLRNGDSKKALSFIDDIDSANAENIKGNINLTDKQYELAFGHFKLALQKKSDSDNALERALPLSWMLNQYEDGLSMLDKVSNSNLDKRKKNALKIAFLIKLKKFEEAQKELSVIKSEFQHITPFEISIMDSYVNMVMVDSTKKIDRRKIEDSSESACKSFDGVSCWIALSYLHWQNIGKTIKRDEEILNDPNLTIENLKKKKEIISLKETNSIDQRDIEELDSETIKLNPN